MRVLFFLLLLLNLLFLGWTRWVVAPTPAPTATAPAGQGRQPIRLRQEAASSRAATGQGGASPDTAAASCLSVGPFLEQGQADAVAASLQRLGFIARPRASVDEVRVGYWVRVPNLATPEDAANALAVLQAAGLSDAYVVTEGDPGNSVSLGVFGDARRAAEVSATVTRAGFTPETSDRLRTMDVFWLDIDRQANGGLPAVEQLDAPEGGLPLEMRACPDASAEVPAAGPAT